MGPTYAIFLDGDVAVFRNGRLAPAAESSPPPPGTRADTVGHPALAPGGPGALGPGLRPQNSEPPRSPYLRSFELVITFVPVTQKLFRRSAEDTKNISQKVQTTTVTHRDDFEKTVGDNRASDRDAAPRLFFKTCQCRRRRTVNFSSNFKLKSVDSDALQLELLKSLRCVTCGVSCVLLCFINDGFINFPKLNSRDKILQYIPFCKLYICNVYISWTFIFLGNMTVTSFSL